MEKFKYIGFKTATVEKRSLTIGALRHRICNVYIKRPNANIILMDIDSGGRTELHSLSDALDFGWNDDCKIEVIGLPHRYGVKDDLGNMEEDAPTIVLFQTAQSELEDGETTLI